MRHKIKRAWCWVVCAVALAMVGCGANAQLKVQTNTAIAVAGAYRSLNTVDEQEINYILVKFKDDHLNGRAALERYEVRHNVAKAAIDALSDLVEASVRDGMTSALVGPMIAGALKVKNAIEALKGGD